MWNAQEHDVEPREAINSEFFKHQIGVCSRQRRVQVARKCSRLGITRGSHDLHGRVLST